MSDVFLPDQLFSGLSSVLLFLLFLFSQHGFEWNVAVDVKFGRLIKEGGWSMGQMVFMRKNGPQLLFTFAPEIPLEDSGDESYEMAILILQAACALFFASAS